MAAATAGYEWNRSSPLRSSPDTSSSMYPDRPIRPLPSRSLRARLSPEQAETIVYPHNPPPTGPLFNFPYVADERVRPHRTGTNDHHACHCGHTHSEVESDEDEDDRNGPLPTSPSYAYSRHASGKPTAGVTGTHRKPASPTSSVDGYESFENTNNKKKRKIPNMGSNGSHHASLSADLASIAVAHVQETGPTEDGDGHGPARYYGSAPSTPQHATASGTGISGAGRGRFGRSGSGRSERRVLTTSSTLANAKANSKRPPEQSGIISTAIANAAATPPPHGNENVSLLQQEAAKNSANKTQFTFTCGSDSANKMVWPGQENGHYSQPPGAYPNSATSQSHPQGVRARPPVHSDVPMVSTQGTQTSPNMNEAGAYPPPPPPPHNGTARRPTGPPPPQQAPPPRKPRRSASKLYEYAARKRRIQQEYANFHNPPSQPWICEFCEYEDIFGHPPMALIRQYEIKDRKERKRLAEKRRLLEKARMKGRKGKKASKKAQNNANNAAHNQNPPPGAYDRRDDEGSLDPQDEYYDDDYDEPIATCPHGCPHHSHPSHPPPQKVPGLPPGDPRGGGPPVTNGA